MRAPATRSKVGRVPKFAPPYPLLGVTKPFGNCFGCRIDCSFCRLACNTPKGHQLGLSRVYGIARFMQIVASGRYIVASSWWDMVASEKTKWMNLESERFHHENEMKEAYDAMDNTLKGAGECLIDATLENYVASFPGQKLPSLKHGKLTSIVLWFPRIQERVLALQ